MEKIYLRESLVEEVVNSKKGEFTSDMCLSLVNGKKYHLVDAMKFLSEVANNDLETNTKDLTGRIISKDELVAKDYDLFDDEIVADDRLYKVEIGYIGTLSSE